MSVDSPSGGQPAARGLDSLIAAVGNPGGRGLPPVERWNPPFCGDIDMRIAADGRWFYLGTPIGRPALVKLFASVLKREGEHHFLVTPVEKVGLVVEDAPFLAVDMAVEHAGTVDQRLGFRTNVDDLVVADDAHPLRFDIADGDGLKPYIHVRRGLWAKLTRPLVYDLVALGETRPVEGVEMLGILSSGSFFPIMPADRIEALA